MRKVHIALILFLVVWCLPGKAEEKVKEKKLHIKVTTSASVFGPKAPATPAETKLPIAGASLTLESPKSADPVAPAVKPPDSGVKNPTEHVSLLVRAARSKEWGVAAGLVLMLIVWAVGWFWSALPNAWIPLLAIVLGVGATVGIDLSTGGVWWRAILNGFATGISSIGCWETLGKQLLGSRKNALAKKAIKAAKKA